MAKKNIPSNKKTDEENSKKNMTLREVLDSSGVPFWWQFDTPIPATDRERKKALESLEDSKKGVLSQLEILRDARNSLKKAQREDILNFASEKTEQARINKAKEDIIRFNEEKIVIERENELTEKERELALTRHDRELREIELESKCRQEAIKEEVKNRDKEIRRKIAGVNTDLKTEKEKLQEIKTEIDLLDGERDELYPLRDKIQSYEGELYLGNYDALDEDNLLQILSVCLFDKDARRYVLNTPRMYAKKQGITVISAKDEDLEYLSKTLKKTLPSYINLRSGEILFESENITSMYRDDYVTKFRGKIRFFDTIVESLKTESRTIFEFFDIKKRDEYFEKWLTVFSVFKDTYSKKISALTYDEKCRIALSFMLYRKDGISIFFDLKDMVSSDLYEKFVEVVNSHATETTILVLTSDEKETFKFFDSKFYKF